MSRAAIKKKTRGATSQIGGAPTPPELSKRTCERPPEETGIPGATRKCVGWTIREADQGKVIDIGTRSIANLRRTGLNSSLSKVSKND